MDIQTEVQKIHHQYGVSEKANYEIQLMCERYAKEAIDTVVSAVENPTYTPADIQAFWLWAYNNGWYGWYYGELTECWYNSEQTDDTKHTIEEVLKLWEETE